MQLRDLPSGTAGIGRNHGQWLACEFAASQRHSHAPAWYRVHDLDANLSPRGRVLHSGRAYLPAQDSRGAGMETWVYVALVLDFSAIESL